MIRLFGSENSPYSIKVRNYMRYKGIPHVWLLKNGSNEEEYASLAKLPIIPTARFPDGTAVQDSTPMMEALELKHPATAVHPSAASGDQAAMLRFVSELLEEFGDEWGNKWMFHYRWARLIDQKTVAKRLVTEMLGGGPEPPDADTVEQMSGFVQKRMSGRGFAVGSNDTTAPMIEASFRSALRLLEAHLAGGGGAAGGRSYLLGGRPSFADFSLGAQLFQALIDPTAGDVMAPFTRVCAWCRGLNDPPSGAVDQLPPFESWASLQPTLEPLLATEVRAFLVWSAANAEAVAAKAESMRVDLGRPGVSGAWAGTCVWEQSVGGPQRYHAKSLKALRAKFAALSTNSALRDVLSRTGCLDALQVGAQSKAKL